MRSTVLALWVSALAAAPTYARDAPTAGSKPNIVFMLADNLGYGELGCYGGGVLRGAPTPRLDALAGQGMRLLNFNVEAQCTPSRSSLLTGRFSIRSGTTRVVRGGRPYGLVQWEITLAEVLSRRGYATGHFGKWHLGETQGRLPTSQGFDEWYGIPFTSNASMWPAATGFDPEVSPVPHVMEGRKGGPSRRVKRFDLQARALLDTEATARTIAFMERHASAGRPFFAYLPFAAVHYPILPHPNFAGKTGAGEMADSLAEMDHHVGRVLDALQRLGIEGKTIVLFTSDNGPEDLPPWRGWAGPWAGSYFTAMEGSLRVPFIMRWPGRIPAASVSNEIVHGADVFTTLTRLAGAEVPKDRIIDGVDQSAFLTGKQPKSNREGFPYYVADTLAAAKWRNWKAHFVWQENKFDQRQTLGSPRLFDLLKDPRERHDVAVGEGGWALYPIYKMLAEFQASLDKEPPIPVGAPDSYRPRR